MAHCVHTIREIQNHLHPIKATHSQVPNIALVPTMGNLHEGHLDLVRLARQHAQTVVVSIFINPLQFGPNEDLDNYPRTLEADLKQLKKLNVKFVFAPSVEEMYPQDKPNLSTISVKELSCHHCGSHRPGHFNGVTTVVGKLFNIIQPDIAVFGAKDYQQLAIIRQMTRDLNFPVTIMQCPINREDDGLARSSRNQYLSPAERAIAPLLHQQLILAKQQIELGQQNFRELEAKAIAHLQDLGFEPDYFNISHAHNLQAAKEGDQELVILTAARLGKTRLIDNMAVKSP